MKRKTKLYLHNGCTYKLITKGISHGTFCEVLPDGKLGKKFVSDKILKDGQPIKETDNSKKLF